MFACFRVNVRVLHVSVSENVEIATSKCKHFCCLVVLTISSHDHFVVCSFTVFVVWGVYALQKMFNVTHVVMMFELCVSCVLEAFLRLTKTAASKRAFPFSKAGKNVKI